MKKIKLGKLESGLAGVTCGLDKYNNPNHAIYDRKSFKFNCCNIMPCIYKKYLRCIYRDEINKGLGNKNYGGKE